MNFLWYLQVVGNTKLQMTGYERKKFFDDSFQENFCLTISVVGKYLYILYLDNFIGSFMSEL